MRVTSAGLLRFKILLLPVQEALQQQQEYDNEGNESDSPGESLRKRGRGSDDPVQAVITSDSLVRLYFFNLI